MSNRMPEDAQAVPQTNSDFMKLEIGENKFRVLSTPIVGYETWVEEDGKKKPIRSWTKLAKEPSNISVWEYGTQFNKYFRAFIVWDYTSNGMKLLQLDKKGILTDIENYFGMEWKEDPRQYDMIIKKTGKGTETKYSLVVMDNKPLDALIKAEWDIIADFVVMTSHFDGGFVLSEAKEAQETYEAEKQKPL